MASHRSPGRSSPRHSLSAKAGRGMIATMAPPHPRQPPAHLPRARKGSPNRRKAGMRGWPTYLAMLAAVVHHQRGRACSDTATRRGGAHRRLRRPDRRANLLRTDFARAMTRQAQRFRDSAVGVRFGDVSGSMQQAIWRRRQRPRDRAAARPPPAPCRFCCAVAVGCAAVNRALERPAGAWRGSSSPPPARPGRGSWSCRP